MDTDLGVGVLLPSMKGVVMTQTTTEKKPRKAKTYLCDFATNGQSCTKAADYILTLERQMPCGCQRLSVKRLACAQHKNIYTDVTNLVETRFKHMIGINACRREFSYDDSPVLAVERLS